MNILSIQSHVSYGHVGHAAATFPLQRLGYEVWPVPTVIFSNHLGYGVKRGRVVSAPEAEALIEGLEDIGALATCDAVLSGYLGDKALGGVVLRAVEKVRAHRPQTIFCCDPVMGDVDEGLYVNADIPDFVRQELVPAADILTPNIFELEHLTGQRIGSLSDATAAARVLLDRGPKLILVTSVPGPDGPEPQISMLAITATEAWLVSTPYFENLPATVKGTGDMVAALFLGHYLRAGDGATALAKTAAAVHGVLAQTVATGAGELQIIEAQEALLGDGALFSTTAVR
ncbi:MAG: pyridoxal kinase PdxY [Alphaproteobacteria bacterium]